MLGSLQDRDQGLGLSGLGRLVDQHLSELQVAQTPIKCSDASSADDISVLQNLIFSLPLEFLELFVVFFVKFALIFLELHQPLHFFKLTFLQVLDLLVER